MDTGLTRRDAHSRAEHLAGPLATLLPNLGEAMYGPEACVWLHDADTWTAQPAPDGETWSVVHRPTTALAIDARTGLVDTFAVFTDPARLSTQEERDRHLAIWEDFRTLALADLPKGDPAAADARIRTQMEQARAWLAVLGALRAQHIREEFGNERGSQAAAARALGVSPAWISAVLTDDDERWLSWLDDAERAVSGQPPRFPSDLD